MNSRQSILDRIAKFNAITKRNLTNWKVVPEFVSAQCDEETFFEEEMWNWCITNGTEDVTQSPEEQGALGQAYIVNGQELFNKFYEDIEFSEIQPNS